MKKICILLMTISTLLCGCSTKEKEIEQIQKEEITVQEESVLGYPSTSGSLFVDGIQLKDENGNIVQLQGVSTHGIAWFPEYINNECFKQMRNEWNVNVVRLAMYTDENGGYCTDGDKESLKQLVKDGIQYATQNDMYVIVDWHVLHDLDPNKYKEESLLFFEEISSEFKDNNNVIYEICNEPNGNTTWAEIKEYAKEVIPIIRSHDEDAIILVGTPNWSQFVDQAVLNPIQEKNIMYSLHFYAATHKDDLRNKMEKALKDGLPIFVSEYGICDASGNGSIDQQQANLWMKMIDKYHLSYVAWNLSNKDETCALIKSSCNKTNNFTMDDLSESGKWLVSRLTKVQLEEEKPSQAIKISNGIEYEYVLKNSWESNGVSYYQYDLTLTSKESYDSWEITVPFKEEFELSDSWNGIFKVDGKNLIISNESYNGSIEKDTKVIDIGFIVTSQID